VPWGVSVSAPEDFTERMRRAYGAALQGGIDRLWWERHRDGLAAVEALVRADERDKIAQEVEAIEAIDGLWAPTHIARRIRRDGLLNEISAIGQEQDAPRRDRDERTP